MSNGPDVSGTQLLTAGALPALVRRPQPTANQQLHPALIMMHGFGANESDIYELVPFVDKRVLIVAPRGPGIAQITARGSYKWYDWSAPGQPKPGLMDTSLEKLSQLIEQLPAVTGVEVDPHQVYIGGFSQGGMMSLAMAANFPQLLAGILPHSGFVSPDSATKLQAGAFRGKPAFVAHGTEDEVLKLEMGQRVRDVLQAGGVDLTYREYPIGHETSLESRRDLADWLNSRLKP